MAHKGIYIRVELEEPLAKFAKDNHMGQGTAINDFIELQLKKEGYL